MRSNEIKLFTPMTTVMFGIVGLGSIAILYRLIFGLGAATNLNDSFPWGIWIVFDVLGGEAMAAGGFMIAGTVYLFNMKKYKPIVRAAIFTAFAGYSIAGFAVMLDIAQPHRIWHPMIMWQYHSIMFIVSILVILYITVLATEFSPMVLEKFGMKKAAEFVETKLIVALVVAGAVLSILHQASLGGLFLIAPEKLHPLWYSSLLPYHFLVSALCMGLAVVSFETILGAKAFRHKAPMDILTGLQRGMTYFLVFYLLMKTAQVITGPGIGSLLNGSYESTLFIVEVLVGIIMPLAFLTNKNFRTTIRGIFSINIMVIAGVLLNRLNVGLFGVFRANGESGNNYFPSAMELLVTITLVCTIAIVYKLTAKYLNLFPDEG